MRNTLLLMILVGVWWTTTDGNNNMCEKKSLTQSSIFLSRTDKHSSTNCSCVIISDTGKSTQVIFNVSSFAGNQYKVSVSNGTATSYFENKMSPNIFYTISGSEKIKVQIEKNNCYVNDGLSFFMAISSNQGNVSITCHNSSEPELCPQSSTLTSTSKVTTTSEVTTTSKVTTTSEVTIEPLVNATITNILPSSNILPSTEISSKETTSHLNDTTKSKFTNNPDVGLIGGLAGGAIVLIFLILMLILCLVRRKQRKKDRYDRPSPRLTPHDGYTGIAVGQQGNNSSSDGVIIIDNVVYDSADSVSPGQPDNTKQNGDGPVQMEIIENDLYISSDDVKDYKSRDANNTNNNTDTSLGRGEMEIIENDLYVSSDDVMNPRDDTKNKPDTDYTVVHKTGKPSKASTDELNTDRKFVLGPHGDEYTVVTKS